MQPKQTQHTESAPRGPNRFQRRLAQLVSDETGDGRTIFDLLNGVMHGTLTGFKPHHRLESAKELASYLTAVVKCDCPASLSRAIATRATPIILSCQQTLRRRSLTK